MGSYISFVLRRLRDDRNFALCIIVLMTFLVRVGVMLALATYKFNPRQDYWAFGHEWTRIARGLLEQAMFSLNGKDPTSAWDPLYVFVIVPFFWAFGPYSTASAVALLLFQAGVCAATAWVIFVLAEKLFGTYEARLAGLMFALYPASIFFAVKRVGPVSLTVLLIGVLFLLVFALQSSSRRRFALAAGVVAGLLILNSSKTQSLILIIPLWLWLTSPDSRLSRVLHIAVFIAAAFLTCMPWSLRNAATFGEFRPSRSDFSYHLWRGNNPEATGYWYTSAPTPEGVVNRYTVSQKEYLSLASTWIAQHPKAFIQLTLKRMKYFWYKITEPRRQDKRKGRDAIHTWIFMTVVSLACIGLFWAGDRPDGVWLLMLFIIVYPLIFYLTHVTLYRYRFPLEPFLLILASRGVHGVLRVMSVGVAPKEVLVSTPLGDD